MNKIWIGVFIFFVAIAIGYIFFSENFKGNIEEGPVAIDSIEHGHSVLVDDSGRVIKKGAFDNGMNTGYWMYGKGKSKRKVVWTKYKSDLIEISYIKKWTINPEKGFLFFALPDSSDSNSFFVVIRYSKDALDFGLDAYLKEVYRQITTDTNEELIAVNFNRLEFDRKTAYEGELLTSISGTVYKSFVLYVSDKEYIYDFSYKIREENATTIDKMIFGDIVAGAITASGKLFYKSDTLVSVREVVFE